MDNFEYEKVPDNSKCVIIAVEIAVFKGKNPLENLHVSCIFIS